MILQWTGERLGAAKMTLQTEDFQQLEADTERKRTGFEKVYSASELVHGQLSKKKPSPEDNKTKVYPIQAWGEMWSNHGMAFSEDSPLGKELTAWKGIWDHEKGSVLNQTWYLRGCIE